MVTIAVVAVLLGLAVPSMSDFIARNRVGTQMNDLLADIHFARTEAVKRASTVTICNSSSKTACTDSSWNDGWIVRLDTTPFEVLRATKAVASSVTLTPTFAAAFVNRIQFQPSGTVAVGAEGFFTLCNSKIKEGRRLTISNTGSGSIKTITTCS